MRYVTRLLAAALLGAAVVPSAALAQAAAPAPAPRPSPAPKYNWVEADYVSSYLGEGDQRFANRWGWRLSTDLLLARPFYFTGQVDNQNYQFGGQDDLGNDFVAELKELTWHAGLGAFVPLTPSTHLALAATYEADAADLLVTDSTGSGSAELDLDGYGIEAAFRAQLTPSVESALSYKYRSLEGDDVERQGNTFGLGLVGNIDPDLALVLKLERTVYTDKDSLGDADTELESYLVGLRIRL